MSVGAEMCPKIETKKGMRGAQTLGICILVFHSFSRSLFCITSTWRLLKQNSDSPKFFLIVLNLDDVFNPLVFFCSRGVMFGHSMPLFSAATNWRAQAVFCGSVGELGRKTP